MTGYALAVTEAEVQRYRRMAEQAAATEGDWWRQAGVVPGAVVADVGCGPAATSVELASAVAPGGRVIGIEREAEALRAARSVVDGADVGDVELRSGQATDTGLEPGSVDVAMLRHVLAHNGGSEQAIVDHLAQVVRPGGSVYLVDVEGSAMRMLDADPDLTDLVERYLELHRRRGNDLSVGLRLGQLLTTAGLDVELHEGRYTVIAAAPGFRPPPWAAREALLAEDLATPDDVARWEAALQRTDTAVVRPTVFIPVFTAFGRRPG